VNHKKFYSANVFRSYFPNILKAILKADSKLHPMFSKAVHWENVSAYTTAAITILGTDAAAAGTLYVDLSTNCGATFTSIPFSIDDITFDLPHVYHSWAFFL